MPSVAQPENLSRYQYSYLAKLSEKAERYDDMVNSMQHVVMLIGKSQLTMEERNMLSVAYKNVVGPRRAAWRTELSMEMIEQGRTNEELLKSYKVKQEEELSGLCRSLLMLLDMYLVPWATASNVKVFYLKMKGDYCRYLAEFKVGREREEAVDETMAAYTAAQNIAVADLPTTHPLRLGLALNFSVFYYEILNEPDKACLMANQAFDETFSNLNYVAEESYKESTQIMQLLRDNLTVWTSDIQQIGH